MLVHGFFVTRIVDIRAGMVVTSLAPPSPLFYIGSRIGQDAWMYEYEHSSGVPRDSRLSWNQVEGTNFLPLFTS